MIHHFKRLAVSIQEDLTDDLNGLGPQDGIEELDDDPGLDLLVKNAVSSNWLEHDPRAVWKQLSARVRGPFGSMAVEGPAMRGETRPLDFGSAAVTNHTPERLRHSYFRLSDSVFPRR